MDVSELSCEGCYKYSWCEKVKERGNIMPMSMSNEGNVHYYRKLPVIISAIQWDGCNIDEIRKFVGEDLIETRLTISIKTLEGEMLVSIGDYVIKGVIGEFYPCKPDIFKKTYEMTR